jgi:hypothetical protein
MTCEKIKSLCLCVCATFFDADCRAAKGVPSRASSGNAHQEPFLFYPPSVYQLLSVRPCVQTAAGAAAREKRRATNFAQQKLEIKLYIRVMVISPDLHDIKMLSK